MESLLYIFIFLLAVVAIAVIKTHYKLNKYEKDRKKTNSHQKMMIF